MKITIDDKIYLINENSKSHRKLIAFLKSVDYFYKTEKYDKTVLENKKKKLFEIEEKLCNERNELYNIYYEILNRLSISEQSNRDFIVVNASIDLNKKKLKEIVDNISEIKAKLTEKENRFKYNKITIQPGD